MAEERWVPVLDWEGIYEVSDQGRVRSLDRVVECVGGRVKHIRGRVLVPQRSRGTMIISLSYAGEIKCVTVNRTVYEAFTGRHLSKDQYVVNNNDNPRDCGFENLRLASRSELSVRPFSAGRFQKKLSTQDVQNIRTAIVRGEKQGDIAKQFGVSDATVSLIKSGRTYHWLKKEVSTDAQSCTARNS